MAAVDIAFVTGGDTRSPNDQPLMGGGGQRTSPAQIPYGTISEMYAGYAQRLVLDRARVFTVPNSGEGQRQIERWRSEHPQDHVRNVYFVGHGNRYFCWRVRVGPDGRSLAPTSDEAKLRPHVEHYHRSGPRIRRDVHAAFLSVLTRSMGASPPLHVVEFRACALESTTMGDTGTIILQASRGIPDLRIELRGYRDFFTIIPSSNGRFRAMLQSIPDGRTIARAAGMGAPTPQLVGCISGRQFTANARCR